MFLKYIWQISVLSSEPVNAQTPFEDRILIESAQMMQASRTDVRGSISSIMQHAEEAAEEGKPSIAVPCLYHKLISNTLILASLTLALGIGSKATIDRSDQEALCAFYQTHFPTANIISRDEVCSQPPSGFDMPPNSGETAQNYLVNTVVYHNHIFLDGRRLKPSKPGEKASNSLIQAYIADKWWVGQITSIFSHTQTLIGKPPLKSRLFRIQWLEPTDVVDTDQWAP